MWTTIVTILSFCVMQVVQATEYCDNGFYCPYDCCYDGYAYYCCSGNFIHAWWFWPLWGLLFILIIVACSCALRKRMAYAQQRRRNVVVVRSYPGYGSTVVNPEVPQYPYSQYSQYPGVVAAVPYQQNGYAQLPNYTAQPPPESEQYKPPPYNPSSTPDTPNQNQM